MNILRPEQYEPELLKDNTVLVAKIDITSFLYQSAKPELLKEDIDLNTMYSVLQVNSDDSLVIRSFTNEKRTIIRSTLLNENFWYGLTLPVHVLRSIQAL